MKSSLFLKVACELNIKLSDFKEWYKIMHSLHHFKDIPNKQILIIAGHSFVELWRNNLRSHYYHKLKGWILKLADFIYLLLRITFSYLVYPFWDDMLLRVHIFFLYWIWEVVSKFIVSSLANGYTWCFLLNYFLGCPDPEGGLFIELKKACLGYGSLLS